MASSQWIFWMYSICLGGFVTLLVTVPTTFGKYAKFYLDRGIDLKRQLSL